MILSPVRTASSSVRPSRRIAGLALALALAVGHLAPALAASGAPAGSNFTPAPLYTIESLHLEAPGCKQDCADLEISYPRLLKGPDAAALARVNQAIQQALIQGLSIGEDKVSSLRGGIDHFFATATAAKKEYPEMPPWTLSLSIEPESYGERLIGLRVDQYTFTGGAHGSPYSYFLNFDLKTGQPVSLEQLLKPGVQKAFEKLAEERFRSDNEINAGSGLQEAGYDFENNRFALPKVFGIGRNGLIFYYNVYEIGPYAAGPTELLLDYYSIGKFIKPEYLPLLAPNMVGEGLGVPGQARD